MATTSKSPKRVLLVAYAIGQQRLPTYGHRFSPKKFTLPQLFACLVLKEFMRLDYRKLSALLEDTPSWAAAIGLASVPHFSTFQKAADRLLLARHAQRLLDETVRAAQGVGLLKDEKGGRKRCQEPFGGTARRGFAQKVPDTFFAAHRQKKNSSGEEKLVRVARTCSVRLLEIFGEFDGSFATLN